MDSPTLCQTRTIGKDSAKSPGPSGSGRNIRVRGIRRDPPDFKLLAQALLSLAQEQAKDELAQQTLDEPPQARESDAPTGQTDDRILILGFDARENGGLNPSSVLTQLLALTYDSGVLAEVLPNSYAGAVLRTLALVDDMLPRAIVLFGYGEDAMGLRLERTAQNCDQAKQPDKDGRRRQGVIIPSAPETLDTTADVDALVGRLQKLRGVTAHSSTDAGGDLYNHLYFALLRYLEAYDRQTPCVLVRIPAHPDRNIQRGAESIIESFLPAPTSNAS